jgi:adenine-specific DNA-methyltransferase
MSKDYSDLEKEDLIKIIEKLESRKKYGLIWDEEKTKEKFEKESENALPVLKEVKSKEIKTDPSKPTNILIEGDNYHALSVLNYTHQGKIDVIYIDPPYNTGNKTWKYNNQYVEKDDAYKHSKWLSFMLKRLCLSKNLLSMNGIILLTIDDHELFNVGILMDEVFGEQNKLGVICIVNKADGRSDDEFIATAHEYMLVYSKNKKMAKINEINLDADQLGKTYPLSDEVSNYKLKPLMSQGVDSLRKDRPKMFFPIYYSLEKNSLSLKQEDSKFVEILPVDPKGIERRWGSGYTRVDELISLGELVAKESKEGKYTIHRKVRLKPTTKTKSFWNDPKHNAAAHGTKLLQAILGKNRAFDYPKSLYAVIDSIAITSKKDSVILDFFAGSGTTGHAVMKLNDQDGGSRQYILCTNNENNICLDVCIPRLTNVISGYTMAGRTIVGLKNNLKYFKTAFVKNSISRDDLKMRITRECTEMLCLREGIFDEVKAKPDYSIFEQNGRVMAIYYSIEQDGLADLKKELDKMIGEKILYCFTFDPLGLDKNDFVDWQGVSLEPIPQKILDIYEQIYDY